MTEYEGLMAETVSFEGHEGDRVGGYMARPSGPRPSPRRNRPSRGLRTCRANQRADPQVCPTRLRPPLRRTSTTGRDRAIPTTSPPSYGPAGGNPDARTVGDVEGAARLLRSLPYSTGKVGIIGYCSGGRQVFLSACSIPSLDAAVDCYGGRVVAGAG